LFEKEEPEEKSMMSYDDVSNNKRFLGCDAREVVEVVASSWYM
jgi:hypothetical protein